ncbi:hypothetical protein DL95DRAFT_402375 [Leptodontidium sp. 2 PMI_412]|nr:hypothetical protein DL95DRAFT_402375 [Leptodontidium sp. 2 PMI_412]
MSPVDEKRASPFIVDALAMDHPPLSPIPTHVSLVLSTLHEPESSHSFKFSQNAFPTAHTDDNCIPISPLGFHQTSRSTLDNRKSGSNETIAFYSDRGRLNLNVEPQETATSALKTGLTLKGLAVWPGHIISRASRESARRQEVVGIM